MNDRADRDINAEDRAFADWLRERLQDSEEQVDLPARRRLAQARAQALTEAGRDAVLAEPSKGRGSELRRRTWIWLPPVAVAAVLALTVFNTTLVPEAAPPVPEWLADGESPEFLQSLEFIEWLDEWDGEA